MRLIQLAPLLLISTVGCAANRPLPIPTLSDWIDAPPEKVLSTAAEAFKARGYFPYLGNPGMVVASKSESTFWTGPVFIAGIAALPVVLITWPVVAIFDTSLHRETTMWWPMTTLAWTNSTYKESRFYLQATPHTNGGSWVRLDINSPEKIAELHARQVLDELLGLKPASKDQP